MDISSNIGISSYGAMTQSNATSSSMRPPPPPPPEAVDGELSGYLSEVEGSEEAKDFMQDFMSMSLSGEFDAEQLAASAPDSLKEYAEEQGVDLEEMMQAANEHFEEMGSKMPEDGNRPPPPPEGASMMNSDSAMYSSVAQYGDSSNELMESLISALSIKTTA